MRALAVIPLLAGACGGHGHATTDAAPGTCTPFSVTAPGGTAEVQPIWAGDSWAIAAGGYVRIDAAGTVTTPFLSDVPQRAFAWDGVELGYYVATPVPHVALFTPGDVSTLHSSPPLGSGPGGTGSVRPDPTGASRIEAYFNEAGAYDSGATYGWSDGTHGSSVAYQTALALAPAGVADLYVMGCTSPVSCGWNSEIIADLATSSGVVGPKDVPRPTGATIVASDQVAIIRNLPGDWEFAGGTAQPIDSPPLAWNGDAFVSFDHGALQLYDQGYHLTQTRPLDVAETVLLGVGATPSRALLVFASASSSTEVRYVQVCL